MEALVPKEPADGSIDLSDQASMPLEPMEATSELVTSKLVVAKFIR